MEEIKSLAAHLGLEKDILFLGQRSDVEKVIQCFDIFLLPSLYEGLGIVLIEAQTNGLSCVTAADVVPSAVNITGNVRFIPLSASDEDWARQILRLSLARDGFALNKVRDAGYDICREVDHLAQRYINMIDC